MKYELSLRNYNCGVKMGKMHMGNNTSEEAKWKSLDICKAAGMGLWMIEMDEGAKPRFYMDETFLEIMGMPGGLTPEEQYATWNKCVVAEAQSEVRKSFDEMIKTGKSEITYACVHPTKGRIYVRCGGTIDKSYKNGVRLRGYHQDVTAGFLEIQKQRSIAQSRLDKIDAFSSIYFTAWDVDIENNRIYAIREADFATPVSKSSQSVATEAITYMIEEYVDPSFAGTIAEFLQFDNITRGLMGKEMISAEYKSLQRGWCRMVIVPERRDERGRVTDVVIGLQGIGAEKQREFEAREKIESALAEAKKADMAKSAFLSQMSHDIRTPLNGIIGLIEISERHKEDYQLVNENRAKAKVAANHLLALINDVLELTKLGDGNTTLASEPFNLVHLMEDVLEIASSRAVEAGIALGHGKCSDQMPVSWVCGSEMHVRQIFLNILDNAIKYNKMGGTVMFRVKQVMRDKDGVTYAFIFEDTGIGMSKGFIDRIYEPFTQERYDARSTYQGTGLGMSIVKNLVDRMEGTIDIQSELGVGTTFTITIPFKIAHMGQEEAEAEEENTYDLSGCRILIAEDNELNMEIASYLLRDAGAKITEVTDGKQAVESFIANPPGTYDLIVMDLMMPVMSGMEAAILIRSCGRSDGAKIPIVAMTANAFEEDVEAVKKAGMNEHLAKPLDTQKVLATINKYYHMVKK